MVDNDSTKLDFLVELSNGHTVTTAAKRAGKPRRTFYDWRDRDPAFAASWDHALQEGTETIEQEVVDRALDRNDNKSHLLLMFLLKGRDPRFKESHKTERKVIHETVHEIDFGFTDEEFEKAREVLNSARSKADQPSE